jgi:hypothetical protein
MFELGLPSGVGAAAVLLALSLLSFVVGHVFRRWPEKVQVFAEAVDGSAFLFSPATHRTLIEFSGFGLLVVSFGTLLAAALVL